MSSPNPVESLQRRHWLAVACLAAFTVVQYAVLFGLFAVLSGDASAVDVAGRQRMLSQRIALFALQLADSSPREEAAAKTQLRDALDSMERQHQGLQDGDEALGLDGTLTPELRDAYYGEGIALNRRVTEYIRHGRDLLDEDRLTARHASAASLSEEADTLLPHLEAAVKLHKAQVDAEHSWIWVVTGGLFLSSLASLALLWGLVLRPGLHILTSDQARLAMAEALRAREEAARQYEGRVDRALELVEEEDAVLQLISRATSELSADAPMEVLLADSSEAHMRVGSRHPVEGRAGCEVENPWQCPALRRGRTSVFTDSRALDACPNLRDRDCAAACVPLTFMGESLGVAHAVFPRDEGVPDEYLSRLEYLASASAARLSTLRSFAQVQLQATTDPLTGLLNRRALEVEVRRLTTSGRRLALGIADLDHFKRLNDTFGHDAGDRALVTFAKAVREALRPEDLLARFGGEEFIIVFADAEANVAADALERVRAHLANVVRGSDTPTFTASFGVSDSRVGSDLAMLIQVADAALLRAKEAGRDRVLVADMGDGHAAAPDSDRSEAA